MGTWYEICTPVTCCAVAWSLKVSTPMTANRARKSPKFETICAYQRRRITLMRRTSRMDIVMGAAPAALASAAMLGDWAGEVIGLVSTLRFILACLRVLQVVGLVESIVPAVWNERIVGAPPNRLAKQVCRSGA